jgi:hypothetical protein
MGKQPTAKVVNTKPIPKLKKAVVENNKEETDFWDYLQEGLDIWCSLKVPHLGKYALKQCNNT